MTDPYHCTGCTRLGQPVTDQCCSCCRSVLRQRSCSHQTWVEKSAFPEDPPQWRECVECGAQEEV